MKNGGLMKNSRKNEPNKLPNSRAHQHGSRVLDKDMVDVK